MLFPGLALLSVTLAFNLLGDCVRDALDPRADGLLLALRRRMITFLVRRLALGLLVLWVITVAVFVLFFVAPHNVARLIAGKLATPQTVALVPHRLGLDRPVLEPVLDFP